MNRTVGGVSVALAVLAGVASAYEWRSHTRMAFHARYLALKIETDARLAEFLENWAKDGFGEDLDTRAGNPCDPYHILSCPRTDEDFTEGRLNWLCGYSESACDVRCTIDHFHPPLLAPFAGNDAFVHAREYFDLAIKLYKSAVCASDGATSRLYFKWAARALGHAIHLVHDMGSPQHTLQENHGPTWLAGPGTSFHEQWTFRLWDQTVDYTDKEGATSPLGHFDLSAAAAVRPFDGPLQEIMGKLADSAKSFPGMSPYPSGKRLSLSGDSPDSPGLLQILAPSGLRSSDFEWGGPEGCPNVDNCFVDSFTATLFPPYGWGFNASHVVLRWGHDFYGSLGLQPAAAWIQLHSVQLAERLWAEPNSSIGDGQNPLKLNGNLNALLTNTTEAASGAILAFWDEVANYQCPCYGFSPCAFRGRNQDPECDKHSPRPNPPGRDSPDDSQGVVANVSAGQSSSVAQFDSVELGKHWRQIAAVGVEKGIPSLVDFGRSMRFLELSHADYVADEGQATIAGGLAELEGKYSVRRPRPEDDMGRAAHVAVLENGFAGEAAATLDALKWTHTLVPINFDPLLLAEEAEILLVPSGALYGTSGSADLRARMAAFVEAGGTLLVLAQMLGEDFGSVPVPEGEVLKAYGWFEDQSCWSGSVRVAAAHPATAGLRRGAQSLSVDGYLEQWPAGATVLLRKSSGGMPALLTYPLGAGYVVVGTIYEDWGRANGQASEEGFTLLGNLLRWGIQPERPRPACDTGVPCTLDVPVTVHNLTEVACDTIAWRIVDGGGWGLQAWTEGLELEPGQSSTRTLQVTPPNDWPTRWQARRLGVLDVTYSLLDSSRAIKVDPAHGPDEVWQVQPEGRAGQVIVGGWPDDVMNGPEIGLGLAVDSEYAIADSFIPIHLSLRNFGETTFSGWVRLSTWAGTFPSIQVDAAPGAVSTYDTVVGPVPMSTGHDGLAGGGFIRAEAYTSSGEGPVATAVKNLLNDPKLFDVTFEASQPTAGPSDELSFFGTLSNQSMGELPLRYRVGFAHRYNTIGLSCGETKGAWHEVQLGHDESQPFNEAYVVPDGCNGVLEAALYFCIPGQLCWDTWDERNGSRRTTEVALPGSRVELDIGQFTVKEGPAFRIPVTVRNAGLRPTADSRVRLVLGAPPGVYTLDPPVVVESEPFALARGETATVYLDAPFTPRLFDLHYLVTAAFRDLTLPFWSFSASRDLFYGVFLRPSTFTAPAGSDEVTGEVRVENRSSSTRHFTVILDQAELGFHQSHEVDIGPFQHVAVPVVVGLPAPQPFGSWPMRIAVSDGDVLSRSTVVPLVHREPYVRISTRTDASQYRAGGTVAAHVDFVPSQMVRELSGTLELTCDALHHSEIRDLTLSPDEAATETFAISLPLSIAAGPYTFTVRWLGPNGYVAVGAGEFAIAPASLAVRRTELEAAAGGSVVYEVRNTGGVIGTFVVDWAIWDGPRLVTSDARSPSLQLDETQQVTFSLPTNIAAGTYAITIKFPLDGHTSSQTETVEIEGVDAELDIGTGSPFYLTSQAIDGWAKATNAAQPFPGATLQLRVLAPRVCRARIVPWGVFQGSTARQGVAPFGGSVYNSYYRRLCFRTAASLPAGVTPIALAAADFNNDRAHDLVAVWRSGSALTLGIFAGPDLAPYASAITPGDPSSAIVAAMDIDGNSQVEIVEADTTADGSVTIRVFDSTLHTRWETVAAENGVPTLLVPSGSPIVANFASDGWPSIVVSTRADVVALDTLSGAVRWRLVESNPGLVGRVVSGTAAADTDGDGRSEAAVAFQVPGEVTGGEVALLDGTGRVRWVHPSAHPVVGSPVLVTSEALPARVAFVQTPDDPTAPSVLTVLDAATGEVSWGTSTPFWSQWCPAAGDVNGDGEVEFVVASGNTACAGCAPQAVLVFSQQGTLIWSETIPGVPASPPALIDMDNDTTLDVVAEYQTLAGWKGLMIFRGPDGTWFAGADCVRDTTPQPLLILDSNGDCLPEFAVGNQVVRAALCIGPSALALHNAPSANGEVVWRWEGSTDLAKDQVWDVPKQLSTSGRTGFFYFVGDLKNSLGQTLAYDESTFSVQTGKVLLALDPLPAACRAGADMLISGSVKNTGASPVNLDLAFVLDGTEWVRHGVTIGSGETVRYSESSTAPAAVGSHTLVIQAISGATTFQSVSQPFQVQEPAVDLAVTAPSAVGQNEFDVTATVTNRTQLPISLDIGLDIQEQPQSPREHVSLSPEGQASAAFRRQISTNTTFVARVSGDAVAERNFPVRYDIVLEPKYVGPLAVPFGSSALHVEVANTGTQRWDGDLTWSLSGATNDGGVVPIKIDGVSSKSFSLPVTLAAGASTFQLRVADVTRDYALTAYAGGYGSVSMEVPPQAVEGEVVASLRVTNLATEIGTFEVAIEAKDEASGEIAATEHASWTLTADGIVEDAIPLALGPGRFLVRSTLNGVPASDGASSLQVLPRYAAELDADLGDPGADGLLPVLVTLRNTGAREVTASLEIEGLPQTITMPNVVVPTAGTAQVTFTIEPDSLPAGDITLNAAYVMGTGVTLASDTLAFNVRPGAATLVGVPQDVSAVAGTPVPVEFLVANDGTQSTSFELSCSVNGEATFSNVQGGTLRGGQRQAVRFEVPLPADLATGRLQGEYALIQVDAAAGVGNTVASGHFAIAVEGAPITVTAEVDRDHVTAGDTVMLRLGVSAEQLGSTLPMVAHVTYPPFDERREFRVADGNQELDFEIPIEEPGGELGFSVNFESGRTLHLDAITIHPAGGPVELALPKNEYLPGEQIPLTVTLNAPGTFEAYGFEQGVALSSSGGVSFTIPSALPRGRYPIFWTFYGSGPDVGVVNGEYPVKVRGLLVRITHLRATPSAADSGMEAVARAEIIADAPLTATLKGWLAGPSGQATFVGEKPVALVAGVITEESLVLDLSSAEAGTGSCIVGIYALDGTLLADAAAQLDVGGGRVLGVRTDKAWYPTVNEAVKALVDVQGSGTGEVLLRLDGAAVATQTVELTGVRRLEVELPGSGAGPHEVVAVLDVSDRVSSASTTFLAGTGLADLTLDLGGTTTEAGMVRAAARVRNLGASGTPASTLSLWDGEPTTGVLVREVEVGALAPGSEAFVQADIGLPEGTHTVTGQMDRGGTIEEFDRVNNVASFEVVVQQAPPPSPTPTSTTTPTPTPTPTATATPTATPTFTAISTPTPTPTPTAATTPSATPTTTSTPTATPTSTPTPTPTSTVTPTPAGTPTVTPTPGTPLIQSIARSYRIGETVRIAGRAEDGSYCAAVVRNAAWVVGDPAPAAVVASATVVSSAGVIPETEVWEVAALGLYDVLLLSGACGEPGARIVAAFDAGPDAGFGVGADPIPTASRAGWLMLVAIVALLGAWLLWVRRT